MDTLIIQGFFRETTVHIQGNSNLREPQQLGHAATLDHFRQCRDHAILRIPVGCGKSGLMGLLPFGLAEGRVLIVTPNLEIRDGVAKELDYSNPNCFWRKTQVLTDFRHGPHIAVLAGSDANIVDCRNAHFVITNIHQLASAADRWLPQFEDDFFDLILVDEGHHNAAASWQRVFERFPNAKVVSLTATPFRSDGQEVEGQVIYRYPFSTAMARGYIKQIAAGNVAPSEISFTFAGDERRHTLEEVLQLREEAWFRRGIALSRETNVSIVDASIRCLLDLRQSGTRHQIIGAACSINHARDIAALYEERGYTAGVVHSQLREPERAIVMRDLRDGRLDCIVQVSVLGEGFDHPPLSVAAIFRPFRSLSAYVQFVGRIMRVLRQNTPTHPDNQGYVISHIGLQQDDRWQDFRNFDHDDQLLFADLLGGSDGERAAEPGQRPRLRPEMIVLEQFLAERFATESFLDPNDESGLDEVWHQIPQLLGVAPEELGITRDSLARRLQDVRSRREFQLEPLPVQPQRARQQSRRRLDEATRSVAGRMLQALQLAPQAPTLAPLYPGTGSNNLAVAIRLVHRAVNEAMEFERNSRAELDQIQLAAALDCLDTIADRIQADIQQRRGAV